MNNFQISKYIKSVTILVKKYNQILDDDENKKKKIQIFVIIIILLLSRNIEL